MLLRKTHRKQHTLPISLPVIVIWLLLASLLVLLVINMARGLQVSAMAGAVYTVLSFLDRGGSPRL